MLPTITPLDLTKQPETFSDPDWLFEVKHDGFRSLAYIQDGCRLVSRKGNEYRRKRLVRLATELSSLPDTILDGELVCLDDEGRTLFYDMMFHRAPAYFYAFDVLWLDGEDLREKPCRGRVTGISCSFGTAGRCSLLVAEEYTHARPETPPPSAHVGTNGVSDTKQGATRHRVTPCFYWCREGGSNPHGACAPADFKSAASTSSAIPAGSSISR